MPLSATLNTFAGNPLDRAGERRRDEDWLAARLVAPATRAVALWNGTALVEDAEAGTQLAYLPMDLAAEIVPGEEPLLFLGLDENDRAVFAVEIEGAADPTVGPLAGRGAFAELRDLAVRLNGPEVAIAATARGVFEWRRRHRFCSNCGAPTRPAEAGWRRTCPVCKAEHFPRTDPVAIMLPVTGDRCLLGRNARFPPGRFSALAGFIEPGESVEEGCARELFEEAGLRTVAVAYHSSQPWPFPGSLMIGLIADVVDAEAKPDQSELVEVRWFSRAEAREVLEGKVEGVLAPPPFTIAYQLIRTWAFGG